uniref:Uncharacterized protein n=1 Tax=Caldisericum exile TaxID=693075 RepID=A0A7C4Y4W7_9BACT
MDYVVLKNEFLTDPKGYGYRTYWDNGQDWKLAELINEVRSDIWIDRDIVPTYEIFEAIVPTEWDALTTAEKQRMQLILSMEQVNVKGENTRLAFQKAFASGTTTRNNLLALLKRNGSRAEELFGAGTVVTWDDVARARRV